MKSRKELRKERAQKKDKTVVVEDNHETPYDLEKVLEELGEVSLVIIYVHSGPENLKKSRPKHS